MHIMKRHYFDYCNIFIPNILDICNIQDLLGNLIDKAKF